MFVIWELKLSIWEEKGTILFVTSHGLGQVVNNTTFGFIYFMFG